MTGRACKEVYCNQGMLLLFLGRSGSTSVSVSLQSEESEAAEAAAKAMARREELQAIMAGTLQDCTARGAPIPLPIIPEALPLSAPLKPHYILLRIFHVEESTEKGDSP